MDCSGGKPLLIIKSILHGFFKYTQSLHFKKYSTASDVWSFGMVMYEIWSLGHKPLEGYTNVQVNVASSILWSYY